MYRASFRLVAVAAACILGSVAIPATSAWAGVVVAPQATTTLGGQWNVISSAVLPVGDTGAQISTPGFSTTGWLPVQSDSAGAPGTEVYALEQNGDQTVVNNAGQITPVANPICSFSTTQIPLNTGFSLLAANPNGVNLQPNVYYSTNMRTCWGENPNSNEGDGSTIPTNPNFSVPWWYQTTFQVPTFVQGQDAKLVVNGIVGQADIWVNGTEVATQEQTEGDYAKYTFDITNLIQQGNNSLALEIYPNDPYVMYTVDNVDWTENPVDNNTGIQFPIQIDQSDQVNLANAHVVENNSPDMSQSAITVKGDVDNDTAAAQTATLSATITAPTPSSGPTPSPITVSQTVTVPANTTQTVVFTPDAFPALLINNPQLWWPYQMGGQPLYTLAETLSVGGQASDQTSETFGIRTITSYLTPPSALTSTGVRQFVINGKPFLFRGGGWLEELTLHYSSADIANQIALIKSLGLNGLRTEGKEMPDNWYEQMDQAGIMIDAGYQCCDNSWEHGSGDDGSAGQSGTNYTAGDYNNIYQAALGIGAELRNHPSVMEFSWSDSSPVKEQAVLNVQAWAQTDFDVPIISSTDTGSDASGLFGPAGEHEGIYDYGSPSYWYATNSSGDGADSVGFGSETSAGDNVPTLDSLNRFMSPADQASLWQPTALVPNGSLTQSTSPCYWGVNQYHTNWENSCPQAENFNFGTMENFDIGVYNRYGSWFGNPGATGIVTGGSNSIVGVVANGAGRFTLSQVVSDTSGGLSLIPAGDEVTAVSNSTVTASAGSISKTSTTITTSGTITGGFAVGSTITGTGIVSYSAGITNFSGTVTTAPAAATTIVSCPSTAAGNPITTTPGAQCTTGAWTLSQDPSANESGSETLTSTGNVLTLAAAATGSSSAATDTLSASSALGGGSNVAPGLNQYVEESQAAMYETNRAEFESNIDHSTNYPNPATGIDYWMLNHAWPALYWTLYNYDYDQDGGYFGVKKADENLHVLYAYDEQNDPSAVDNNQVTVDNLTGATESNLSVTANVYTINGATATNPGGVTLMSSQTASGITLPAQGVQNNVITETPGTTIPAFAASAAAGTTYFVELLLSQNGTVVDHNVYWVSTWSDNDSTGSPAPTFSASTSYGNLTQLQTLSPATVSVVASSKPQAGPDGDNTVSNITITNTSASSVAYFVRADVRQGSAGGTQLAGDSYTPGTELAGDNEVEPITYSDDDITLFPGESQTIQAFYNSADLGGATPVDSVSGWNVQRIDVLDPETAGAQAAQQASASAAGTSALGVSNGDSDATAAAPSSAASGTASTPAESGTTPAAATPGGGSTPAASATPGDDNTPQAMSALKAKIAVVSSRVALHGRTATVTLTCSRAPGAGCTGALVLSALVHQRVHGHNRTVAEVIARRAYSLASSSHTTLRFAVAHGARLGRAPTLVVHATPSNG